MDVKPMKLNSNLMPGFLKKERAFTLIELLTVISIIGLLAAMILGIAPLATAASRKSRMNSEHQRLLAAIDSYKAELGNYPPDNPANKTATTTNDLYKTQ